MRIAHGCTGTGVQACLCSCVERLLHAAGTGTAVRVCDCPQASQPRPQRPFEVVCHLHRAVRAELPSTLKMKPRLVPNATNIKP